MRSLRAIPPLLGLLLGLASCDWLKDQVFDVPPPVPPPHAKHDLVVENGKAFYNGTFIGPGESIDVWKRLFGPPSREGGGSARWDDLGLAAHLDLVPGSRPGVVKTFDVYVEVFPAHTDDPAHAFPGRLLVDGAPLHRGVKMTYVNYYFRNDACVPPGGGVRFGESGLPGHYECAAPAYSYWLQVYEERRAAFVRRFALDAH